MPKTKSKSKRRQPVCALCETSIDDEILFGKFYVTNEIAVHNFCLLFSSGLGQNGETDDDGIAGFLVEDIKKEIIRGKKLRCSFCKTAGATVGCCKPSCKKVFHLSCGLEKKSMHQFFGSFLSYCSNHRPARIIPDMRNVPDNVACAICYNPVYPKNPDSSLWMSCCKNGWFHKACIQKQAMSAGYFFRCPLCNNTDDFQKQMLHHGVYIPQQDASWELEENAYQDLLFRHWQCDAVKCICPKGRKYHKKSSPWCIICCDDCGSQGRHARCENLRTKRKWTCVECMEVTKRLSKSKLRKRNMEDHSNQLNTAEYVNSEIPTVLCLKSSLSFCKREASFTSIDVPEKKTCISPDSIHVDDSIPKPSLELPTKYCKPCKSDDNTCKIVDTTSPTISSRIEIEEISQDKRLSSLGSETKSLSAKPVNQLQTTRVTLDDVSSSRILQGSDLNSIEDFSTLNPSSSQHGIENLPPASESQKQQICLEIDKDKKHELCPHRKRDPVVIIEGCITQEGSLQKSFPLASHNASNSIHEKADSAAPLNGSRKRTIAGEKQHKTVKKQKLNHSSKHSRSSINSKWNRNSYLCIKALFGKPCFCCENKRNNTVSTSHHPKCSRNGSTREYAIDVLRCGPGNRNTSNRLCEIASDSNSTQIHPLSGKITTSREDKNTITKKESFVPKSCFSSHSSSKYTIDIVRSGPQSSASEGIKDGSFQVNKEVLSSCDR